MMLREENSSWQVSRVDDSGSMSAAFPVADVCQWLSSDVAQSASGQSFVNAQAVTDMQTQRFIVGRGPTMAYGFIEYLPTCVANEETLRGYLESTYRLGREFSRSQVRGHFTLTRGLRCADEEEQGITERHSAWLIDLMPSRPCDGLENTVPIRASIQMVEDRNAKKGPPEGGPKP